MLAWCLLAPAVLSASSALPNSPLRTPKQRFPGRNPAFRAGVGAARRNSRKFKKAMILNHRGLGIDVVPGVSQSGLWRGLERRFRAEARSQRPKSMLSETVLFRISVVSAAPNPKKIFRKPGPADHFWGKGVANPGPPEYFATLPRRIPGKAFGSRRGRTRLAGEPRDLTGVNTWFGGGRSPALRQGRGSNPRLLDPRKPSGARGPGFDKVQFPRFARPQIRKKYFANRGSPTTFWEKE